MPKLARFGRVLMGTKCEYEILPPTKETVHNELHFHASRSLFGSVKDEISAMDDRRNIELENTSNEPR